jgi:hypothetical protein
MLDKSEILVRDETIQIQVKRSIDKKQLEDAANLETLMEIATQLFGRPLRVQIDFALPAGGNVEPVATSGRSGSAVQAPNNDLVQAAQREPAVRTVLDTFGGRIVEVRRRSAAAADPDPAGPPAGAGAEAPGEGEEQR